MFRRALALSRAMLIDTLRAQYVAKCFVDTVQCMLFDCYVHTYGVQTR